LIVIESYAMESYFQALTVEIRNALQAGERFTASFAAEATDFVRMNRGKVRQPGTVVQRYLALRLIAGTRHAAHDMTLTGDAAVDGAAVRDAVAGLRTVLPELAEDPHLLLPSDVRSSRAERGAGLPPSEAVIESVLAAADGLDLVGIYAAGPVWRGFANSEGQHNWHATTTFNLEWSLYHRADKAVKSSYAGFGWDAASFAHKMADARERLALISRPPKALAPGKYRAFLSPSALDEVMGLLGWGGFSGRALATQQSALAKMRAGETLDRRVTIAEDTASGTAPGFQAEGFARPARVPLVQNGALVGSRTAREFDLAENGANGAEMPESLAMEGGALAADDALAALDTGLAIGNLWYLNYSDRPACRITGMTRFATFWVEGGEPVAPVAVMRFDDSLYHVLGDRLEGLTRERELLLSADTYGGRGSESCLLPGVLVDGLELTL
jgi:predicted Zn-dependent protease